MEPKKLYRSRNDKYLFGVCGGLAKYFNADSTVVRIIFVIGGFISLSALFWVYLVCGLVIPQETDYYN